MGGLYCDIWDVWYCAAVKGVVFNQFSPGSSSET